MTATSPRRAVGPLPGERLRVVVCPDSFKGTATALEVAGALREGWLSERPADDVRLAPLADGGEGTLDAMQAATPGTVRHEVSVAGPIGEPRRASWLELPDGTAVVELADTSGIGLLDELAGLDAHTRGLGQAIRAALDAGAARLLIALGGSASTDGGTGLLTALGARFLTAAGTPIAPGARGLAELDAADLTGLVPLPRDGAIVLSDVRSPLTGPGGAAAVFGPQKGLTPEQIPVVDSHLARLAALLGVDPAVPGTSAAGGTGAGLLAWGARLTPGAPEIARTVGLPALIADAHVVITGEGRYDAQSAEGKVVSLVEELTDAAGARLAIAAGSLEAVPPEGTLTASLTRIAGRDAAMAHPIPVLVEAGRYLAQDRWGPG